MTGTSRGQTGKMLATTQLECVRGERRLFANLSFDALPHTLLEVRGPNGSGKTSLLRNLCGLLPVAEGTVSWKGSDIRELGDEYRAQLLYLGHLPGIKDELTALENLRFHAAASGLPATETELTDALDRMGLNNFQHQHCKALSAGQRRRVALARLCLAATRPLWILDEPFTALDVAALAVITTIVEGHLESGGIVVLTTHQEVPIKSRETRRVELGR